MTDFKEIDAQIAKKTAELETLRWELEQLQAKKSHLLHIERNGKEERRIKFEKDFDREKSAMNYMNIAAMKTSVMSGIYM